jgi:hypothetical protein
VVVIFEYLGFIVHRLAMRLYLVTGPGFRGYATSENQARQTIDGVIAGQCDY